MMHAIIPSRPEQALARLPGDSRIGKTIARCLLERRIGQGGMGAVYLARHLTLNKQVAVKVLRGDLPTDMQAVERFLREARAAARLEHQRIVPIYDAGEEDGTYYIVMQYVQGESLASCLQRVKSLPVAEAVRIFRAVAEGIAHAHASGIIHRDIKPDNILLGEDGSVKLVDFGLARMLEGDTTLSRTGTVFGSPNFMSPEQALGHSVDQRTDVYSLGATLYHMMTGVPPFLSSTSISVVCKVVREPLVPPHVANPAVPIPLSRFICLLMRKDVEKRVRSVREAVSLLARTLADARRDESSTSSSPRRRVSLLGVATVLMTCTVIGLAVLLAPWKSWTPTAIAPGEEAAGILDAKEVGATASSRIRLEGTPPDLSPPTPAAAGPSTPAPATLVTGSPLAEDDEKSIRLRFEGLRVALASRKVREVVPYLDPEFLKRAPLGAWRKPWNVVKRLSGGIEDVDVREAKLEDLRWEVPERRTARARVTIPGKEGGHTQLWVHRDGSWFLLPPIAAKEK